MGEGEGGGAGERREEVMWVQGGGDVGEALIRWSAIMITSRSSRRRRRSLKS